MELTMNQANMNLGNANAEWGSTGWRLPEFGFQKYVAEAVKSIFHTIHSSFDYHSKATTRELLVFLVYAVVLQGFHQASCGYGRPACVLGCIYNEYSHHTSQIIMQLFGGQR